MCARIAEGGAGQSGASRWIERLARVGFAAKGLLYGTVGTLATRAFKAKLNRNVSTGDIAREGGAWLIMVSRIGIAARGLVFVALGWLLGLAGVRRDPEQSGGVDRGLDVFAELGSGPLVAIGAGLVAYGVYQLLSARYRRIRI